MSQIRMLKLLPHDVASRWEMISPAIEVSLPPTTEPSIERMSKVLESILSGKLDVFVFFKSVNGVADIYAVVTTTFVDQLDRDSTDMLIYSIYGDRKGFSMSDWVKGLEYLKDYAKSKGAVHITGYTNENGLINFVKGVGGGTTYQLVVINI
jgi:hypothetical protein